MKFIFGFPFMPGNINVPTMLISKIQYKNCETGEYFNKQERSCEETLRLISDFPWKEQRSLTPVALTCPSVTVEHPSGSFLKIGPYYNGKFCLYLLSSAQQLSIMILSRLEDGFPVIAGFYDGIDMPGDFQRDHWARHPRKHFVTNAFEYTVTVQKCIDHLLFPPVFFLAVFAFVFITAKPRSSDQTHTLAAISGSLLLFTVYCGANVYLFFNYYFFSSKLYLRLSKAHDHFFFGTKATWQQYSKQDIEKVLVCRNTHNRCPWYEFAVYEIHFKNGYYIRFTSLLMKQYLFESKFPGIPVQTVHEGLPRIR